MKATNRKEKAQFDILQKINEEYGRIPPQSSELEEVVLGALMIEKNAIIDVIDVLKPEAFYSDTHQKIYRAIVKLSENLKPIDILTVTEQLRQMEELDNVGGPYYITQLTSRVSSAAHVLFHSRIIAQKFIQRELIRVSSEIQSKAFDPSQDVDDLLDFSERELFNIASGNIKKDTAKIDSIITQAVKQMEEAGKREDGLSGVPCGFTELDRITSGWQNSDMIVIAARPSMGKTAFVLSMMRNIAVDHNQAVALFSLEMSSVQLVNRLLISETGLSSEKIKTGKISGDEWNQFYKKVTGLSNAPILIDDTPAISIFELRAKCRRLKAQHDIKLIVIDYLQLMSGSGDSQSREQEVSMISRGLKAVAKELNVPIIALSQLNRSVELRGGDKRPQISDLRESGAIEQDADIVIFIHRPERFGITEDEEGNSTKGLAEIIIAKHRNGEVCDVKLRFIAEQARFADWDDMNFGSSSGFESLEPQTQTFKSKMNSDEFGIQSNSNNFNPQPSFGNNPPSDFRSNFTFNEASTAPF
jgi:replicative DNA helicase